MSRDHILEARGIEKVIRNRRSEASLWITIDENNEGFAGMAGNVVVSYVGCFLSLGKAR